MERSLEAVQNSNVGLNAAFRKYSLPKDKLKRHLVGKNYFAAKNTQVIRACETSLPMTD